VRTPRTELVERIIVGIIKRSKKDQKVQKETKTIEGRDYKAKEKRKSGRHAREEVVVVGIYERSAASEPAGDYCTV